jgi:hypothetical protein
MKALKELITAMGRKRAVTLFVLIALILVMTVFWQKYLIPQQQSLSFQLARIQSDRTTLQAQIRELPAKHAALVKKEQRYIDLEKQGLFIPQDRIDARAHMDAIRQAAGLRGITYKIDPQNIIDKPTLTPLNKILVMSSVDVDMRGLTDHEIMRFLDRMQKGFNGLVVLKEFKMTKEMDVTPDNLLKVKNGENGDFISASVKYDWYSITPKSEVKNSPLSQAFQGSTP